jgi:hypothetical protein
MYKKYLRLPRAETTTLLHHIDAVKWALSRTQSLLTHFTREHTVSYRKALPQTSPIPHSHFDLTLALHNLLQAFYKHPYTDYIAVVKKQVDTCKDLVMQFHRLETELDEQLGDAAADGDGEAEIRAWVRYGQREGDVKTRLKFHYQHELAPLLEFLAGGFRAGLGVCRP